MALKMGQRIMEKELSDKGLPKSLIAVFSKTFPDGFVVSKKNLQRLLDEGLSVGWLALNFLDASTFLKYRSLCAASYVEINKVQKLASAAYRRGNDHLADKAKYAEDMDVAWAKYDADCLTSILSVMS